MPEVCPKCKGPMSANICSHCGLPADICACVAIEQAEHKIRVSLETRRFNKPTTIIEGIADNTKDIAKQLKSRLACGGTIKEGHIELQGNHKDKVKPLLLKLGYSEDQIEIS